MKKKPFLAPRIESLGSLDRITANTPGFSGFGVLPAPTP